MRFTETVRVITLSCDRCDTRINENEQPHGWLFGDTFLSEAPTAVVQYHLCPACRDALGTWMANEPTHLVKCPTCGGAGATSPSGPDPDTCQACRGTGWAEYLAGRARWRV